MVVEVAAPSVDLPLPETVQQDQPRHMPTVVGARRPHGMRVCTMAHKTPAPWCCVRESIVVNPRRTEALSDSTFAVAMTLLIFDVRLPAPRIHNLGRDLWFNAWPHYLGYAISFTVIGMIWVSHHTIFRLVRAIDHRAMVVNLALLGLVVFIPFPTQVLALYISQGTTSQKELAVAFYGLSLAAATLMLAVLWHSMSRPALVRTRVGADELKRITRRYYFTPVLYLAATGLALVDDRVGIVLFLVIGSGYLLHTGTRVAPPHPDDVVPAEPALDHRVD